MDLSRVLVLMAHELRSPASVISGYLRLMREDRLDAEGRAQAVTQINRAAAAVSTLGRQASELSKWLAFAPGAAGTSTVVPLVPLIREAIARIDTASEVRCDTNPGLDALRLHVFDGGALSTAVTSLLAAVCREALGAPVRVTLSAGNDNGACAVRAATALSNGASLEPLASGDASSLIELGGYGLSLVIATAVVAAHRGAVVSAVEHPGVVEIRLPLAKGEHS